MFCVKKKTHRLNANIFWVTLLSATKQLHNQSWWYSTFVDVWDRSNPVKKHWTPPPPKCCCERMCLCLEFCFKTDQSFKGHKNNSMFPLWCWQTNVSELSKSNITQFAFSCRTCSNSLLYTNGYLHWSLLGCVCVCICLCVWINFKYYLLTAEVLIYSAQIYGLDRQPGAG